MPAPARKKLIEVALPLDAINVAAAREKSIRHGHPSTLHLWWQPATRCPCARRWRIVGQREAEKNAVGELLAGLKTLIERWRRV